MLHSSIDLTEQVPEKDSEKKKNYLIQLDSMNFEQPAGTRSTIITNLCEKIRTQELSTVGDECKVFFEYEQLSKKINQFNRRDDLAIRNNAIYFLQQKATLGYDENAEVFLQNKNALEKQIMCLEEIDRCVQKVMDLPKFDNLPLRDESVNNLYHYITTYYPKIADNSVNEIAIATDHFLDYDKNIIHFLGKLENIKNYLDHPTDRKETILSLQNEILNLYPCINTQPECLDKAFDKVIEFIEFDQLAIEILTSAGSTLPGLSLRRDTAYKKIIDCAMNFYKNNDRPFIERKKILQKKCHDFRFIDNKIFELCNQLPEVFTNPVLERIFKYFKFCLTEFYLKNPKSFLEKENEFLKEIETIKRLDNEIGPLISKVNQLQYDMANDYRLLQMKEVKKLAKQLVTDNSNLSLNQLDEKFKELDAKTSAIFTIDEMIKQILKKITTKRSCKYPELIDNFKFKLAKFYIQDVSANTDVKSELNQINHEFHALTISIDRIFSLNHSDLPEDQALKKKIARLVSDACSHAELDYAKTRNQIDYIYYDIVKLVELSKEFSKRNNRNIVNLPEHKKFHACMEMLFSERLLEKAQEIADFNDPIYDDALALKKEEDKSKEKFIELKNIYDLFYPLEDDLSELINYHHIYKKKNFFQRNYTSIYNNAKNLLAKNISEDFEEAIYHYVQKVRDLFRIKYCKHHPFANLAQLRNKNSPITELDDNLKELITIKPMISHRLLLSLCTIALLIASVMIATILGLIFHGLHAAMLPLIGSSFIVIGPLLIGMTKLLKTTAEKSSHTPTNSPSISLPKIVTSKKVALPTENLKGLAKSKPTRYLSCNSVLFANLNCNEKDNEHARRFNSRI